MDNTVRDFADRVHAPPNLMHDSPRRALPDGRRFHSVIAIGTLRMDTQFTPSQLKVPYIREAAGILKDCVHYGFCTAVCPTYVLLRDELDAPRGRIDLIREMLEAGVAPSARTVGYIDRCLSCNSCMSTCAAKVDYMHLADIARAYIEANYRRPLPDRMFRWMLARTVPDVHRFRRAIALARLARPLANLLPRRLRTLLTLAPARLPAAAEALSSGTYPAEGKTRKRVLLLAGCVQQALAPRLNHATVRLLTRHGISVTVAAGVDCCGAFTLHMGKEERAKASARATIEAWTGAIERSAAGDAPIDAVVVNASGCGTTVKDYGRIFAHEPDIAGKAVRIAEMAVDVSELLTEIDLNVPDITVPLKVAYHDACSLQHAQKVTAPPRKLLRAAGFRLRDVPEAHFCCGSAGAYNMLQPAIAQDLGRRKATHIESTGADALAAGNLGCLTQLSLYTGLPALHTVELLDWATGGPLPDALRDIDLPAAVSRNTLDETAAAGPGAAIW
jgi:glycolate oxidase iron-sulfur subunit